MPWLVAFFGSRYIMRPLRYGKRKIKNCYKNQNGKCMSKLWSQILILFQQIGDRSGCHQIPDRCFKIKGYVFPVCARCTGVGVGQILAIITFFLGVRINVVTCVILLGIMGLDWLIQYRDIKQSTNARRFITGIFGGYGVFGIYFNILMLCIDTFKRF